MVDVIFENGLGLIDVLTESTGIEILNVIVTSDLGKLFFAGFDRVAKCANAQSNYDSNG